MSAKGKKTEATIDVVRVSKGQAVYAVLGTTPLICNRMSQKAQRELLLPSGRKNAAAKASTLKHNPLEEFRASPYTDKGEGPTLIQHLSASFKRSLQGAALDLAGASKSQIGRLTWVEGERISIYGVPKMLMSVVRSADINHTPDIRTRAILPEWACFVRVYFVTPNLREQAVADLLVSAGITQGVGDWRTGKGAGTYGSFVLTDKDDPDFKRIIETGGREAQLAAMESPEPYDDETAEMYEWYQSEAPKRGFKSANGAAPSLSVVE